MGLVLGVITYFIFSGGIIPSTQDAAKEPYYIALSFIAGFAAKQLSEKLKELSSTLFSKGTENKPTETDTGTGQSGASTTGTGTDTSIEADK